MRTYLPIFIVLLGLSLTGCPSSDDHNVLYNVSYDPTRELYEECNEAFIKHYKEKTGETVRVDVSHGGSSKQARAVIDGLPADVVTLALAYDIENISQQADLLPMDWQTRFPHNSTPYSSTVVFLVRKGNPKNIKSWDDLVQPGAVKIIVAHPKSSGVARWAYLAGWGYALKKELGDLSKIKDPDFAEEVAAAQVKAKEFITALYKNVIALPEGARSASQAFVQAKQGDVIIDWENQAKMTINDAEAGEYEIVVPSISILAEPPVAVLDKNVDKRGTRKIAEEYLDFLYTPEGQDIVARHFYRPRNEEILAKYADNFVSVEMFTIDDVFGGWQKAQQEHFENGGVFDQIYNPTGE